MAERPGAEPGSPDAGRPNILFVFVDNLGYGELGCYGGGEVRGVPTPNIDRLAAEGMRLTNMNMEAQCTPSRSAVMTGRLPIRSGTVRIPLPGRPSGLTRWEVTLAELLSSQGYRCGHYGKWHLGDSPGRQPHERGFDEWWGLTETHDSSLWSTEAGYDPAVVPPEQLLEGRRGEPSAPVGDYDVAQRALFDAEAFGRGEDFMRRCVSEGQPFFLYLPLAFPHFPTLPHPDYAGVTGLGEFTDAFRETDDRVGRLVGVLDELDIAGDTLVIFTSDNGAEDVLPWRGWTGPWGGSYFTAMEGSLRVPFIARWPGRIPAGRSSNELAHATDIFTTLARSAGAEIPADRPIDGIDLMPMLEGASDSSGRESVLCFVADRLHAVKWRNWKLHFIWQEYMGDPPIELSIPRAFNLYDDPRERHDVFLPSNTWVQRPVMAAVAEFWDSVAAHPLIPVGAEDPYVPPAV
ncbi:arylsulfatase [Candidatus Poriferisodalis sp.]|uniref:arylsulfatase n=1 Tax=Candidatus Poriferisodalis sp. TaxID=3101277 RepID=UPI003B0270EB